MADRAATVPKITRVLEVKPDGAGYLIWVACEDGKKYHMPLAATGVGSFIDAFREISPLKGGLSTLNTLTVLSSQAVARPDGAKALALTTQEAGTIAFALSENGIQTLLKDLAALQGVQKPTTKQ